MLYKNQQQHPLRWSVSVAPAELVLVGGLCARWRMAFIGEKCILKVTLLTFYLPRSLMARDKRRAISVSVLWRSPPIFVCGAFVNAAHNKKVKARLSFWSPPSPPWTPPPHPVRLRAPFHPALLFFTLSAGINLIFLIMPLSVWN